jgi:uncharacterized coiled-coil DUF342 family protein
MKDTIKKQIEDLLKKRKDSLGRIREISEAVRLKATEVAKLRHDFGLRSNENERGLKKRVEELELKISTENLPLKIERELAEEIAVLEKRISAIKEIEKKKSKIGTLEIDIKKMKEERERLKKAVDTDINEVESLRQEMQVATEREEGQFDDFCLGDLVTVKKESGKKSNN